MCRRDLRGLVEPQGLFLDTRDRPHREDHPANAHGHQYDLFLLALGSHGMLFNQRGDKIISVPTGGGSREKRLETSQNGLSSIRASQHLHRSQATHHSLSESLSHL